MKAHGSSTSDRGIYFAKYYGGGGGREGMAAGKKNKTEGVGKKNLKAGKKEKYG